MRWNPRTERLAIVLVAGALFVGLSVEIDAARLPQAFVRGVKRVSFALATRPRAAVKLMVPFHRQEHALSCEAAALTMALQARGVKITESTLIQAVGFDPTPKRSGVWGDPQQAFVGDINGRSPNTGYGVYWEPIARVAQRYRKAEVMKDPTVPALARELAAGNPVVVWGYIASGRPIRWRTPEGRTVNAVSGEHARVAVGFAGTVESPRGIFLLDPIYGEVYMDQASFDRNWSALDRGAVVVR